MTFMAKLGWRLLNGKDTLWARVITSKYNPDEGGIGEWREKQWCSNLWKGIVKSKDLVEKMEATRDRGGGNNRHAQFPTARAYDATVGEALAKDRMKIETTYSGIVEQLKRYGRAIYREKKDLRSVTWVLTSGSRLISAIRWKPKTKEELILNVDGSFREENRKVGGGAILRTRDGKWIAGCSQKFNAHNPREAELMALEMGLKWVRKMSINRLEIQCDNVDVETDKALNGPFNAINIKISLQWIKESLLGRVLRDAHQGTWLNKQGRRNSGPNKRPMEVMRLGILPMTFSSCLQEKKRWSRHHSYGISPEKSRASNTMIVEVDQLEDNLVDVNIEVEDVENANDIQQAEVEVDIDD
nr:Ribonuclease H protein [Ipomoea batatas]